MKNIIPSALQTMMSLEKKGCSRLSCSLFLPTNNAEEETRLLPLGSHRTSTIKSSISCWGGQGASAKAKGRQRQTPFPSASLPTSRREPVSQGRFWAMCRSGCIAQFSAFGCARFRFRLTASGTYLVIDCTEKCKEAFNSNHLRLFSLCSQTETYWSVPG